MSPSSYNLEVKAQIGGTLAAAVREGFLEEMPEVRKKAHAVDWPAVSPFSRSFFQWSHVLPTQYLP